MSPTCRPGSAGSQHAASSILTITRSARHERECPDHVVLHARRHSGALKRSSAAPSANAGPTERIVVTVPFPSSGNRVR